MDKKLIFSIVLAIMLIGCVSNPKVRFTEPQPVNKRDLKRFPQKYQGQYISKSDSSILTIDSKYIIQEWSGFSIVSFNEMFEELDTVYKDNITIQLSANFTMTITVDNDSARIETYGIDTIFTIHDLDILRGFKGHLFLNYYRSDSTWRVKTLSLDKESLMFDDLVEYWEIDSLVDITEIETEIDTSSNRARFHDLKPSRKELKEILAKKQIDSRFIKVR